MYVAPDSKIYLLSGVPLTSTYEHTLYFTGPDAQNAYFQGKVRRIFNNQSYVRHTSGYVRVEMTADQAYDCNYMMFQNTAFGNKWFYAFINSIEYINNSCAQVNYEIDVMQTWLFETELLPSYVVREHSATDGIGDNIAAEPVDIGSLVCLDREVMAFGNQYHIVVARAQSSVSPQVTSDAAEWQSERGKNA